MNDTKNMILAVVLSALVLLGWTWAANRYFPTATPQRPRSKTASSSRSRSPRRNRRTPTPQALRRRARGARLDAAHARSTRHRYQGSINLKGAQIDDLSLVRQTRPIAKDSPPVRLLSPLGAPDAYIAVFGWTARGVRRRRSTRFGPPTATTLTPGQPVTLSTQTPDGTRYPAQDRGRRRLSVHRRAARHQRLRPAASTVRPIGLVSRSGNRPTRRPGRTMSDRSACSAARPIMTSAGRTSTRPAPSTPTGSAAGLASPTNIG